MLLYRQEKEARKLTDQTPTKSERFHKLQNEVRKAELESALDDVRGVLLNITSDMDKKEERLGPTVTTTMKLEGMPVHALVDMGYPVSIVSLHKLLLAFARKHPSDKSSSMGRRNEKEN